MMKNIPVEIRRYLQVSMILAAILSMLPMIVGTLSAQGGWQFLGYPFATDDHMVYASWMRQAQDGHLFFDNRFTSDSQPALTINLYFFVAGLISKIFGIAWTTTLLKAAFSAWFVWLVYQLIDRFNTSFFSKKLGLVLATFGSGLGFLVWHQFGETITKETSPILGNFLLGRLPTDVWQPEGFVFSSMLTNSLFMVSICLILVVFLSILDSEHSWKPVLPGAVSMFLIANIHSYDSLLLGLVAVAFLVSSIIRKEMTAAWAYRGLAIFCGAIPPAIWLWYVMKKDQVFAARAATLTYSPNFREVLIGYGLLIVLGVLWIASRSKEKRTLAAGAVALVMIVALVVIGATPHQEFFLSWSAFGMFGIGAILVCILSESANSTQRLVLCWAIVGIVAIYIPFLFQRKLAMGLSIPWSILAACYLSERLEKVGAEPRRLVTGFSALVICLTSVFWLQREIQFIKGDVGRTTVHSLFLPSEVVKMLDTLNSQSGRKVLLALPGVPDLGTDSNGLTAPDFFIRPLWSEMNTIFSGFAGCYTYAGHWSETPNYVERRKEVSRFFFKRTEPRYRQDLVAKCGANYILGPATGAFGSRGASAFLDVSTLGEVVAEGKEFVLIKIDPKKLQLEQK